MKMKTLTTSLAIGAALSGVTAPVVFAENNLSIKYLNTSRISSANPEVVVIPRDININGKVHRQDFSKTGFQTFFNPDKDKNNPLGQTWALCSGYVSGWTDKDFFVYKGFFQSGDKLYYSDQYGDSSMGLTNVNGDLYLFNEDKNNPYARTEWQIALDSNYNFNKYYFDRYTFKAKKGGFSSIKGETYLFDKEGRLQTGMQTIDGKKYYLRDVDGRLVTGFYSFGNGDRYFFNPEKGGAAQTGGYNDGIGYMYFNQYGVMQKGIFDGGNGIYLTLDSKKNGNYYQAYGFYTDRSTGRRYYFNRDNQGKAQTGWYPDSNGVMYFHEKGDKKGVMATGITGIGDDYYLFLRKGTGEDHYRAYGYYSDMHTTTKDRYYFNPDNNGRAQKGWFKNTKGTMFFNSQGVMATGICDIDGSKNLFLDGKDGNHYKTYGWYNANGKRYYFNPDFDGRAVTNDTIKIGREYHTFDKDGNLISSH